MCQDGGSPRMKVLVDRTAVKAIDCMTCLAVTNWRIATGARDGQKEKKSFPDAKSSRVMLHPLYMWQNNYLSKDRLLFLFRARNSGRKAWRGEEAVRSCLGVVDILSWRQAVRAWKGNIDPYVRQTVDIIFFGLWLRNKNIFCLIAVFYIHHEIHPEWLAETRFST